MPAVFVTSDIHLSHLNILKYNVATRGMFNSVDEMNEAIVQRWNETVGPEDHTFILGDVSMGDVSRAPGSIQRLNGTKTLILGNHDRSLMKIEGIRDLFHGVYDYLVYSHSKQDHFVMFHYPIASWDGKNHGSGSFHLHGHLHGAPSGIKGRAMDVGMDCNDLRPFSLDAVAEKLRNVPKPEYDHHGATV